MSKQAKLGNLATLLNRAKLENLSSIVHVVNSKVLCCVMFLMYEYEPSYKC